MAVIDVENLTKKYNKGKVVAVNDVSFQVEKGELFGLIGPDGAGKTTIFRVLTTLLLPDSGNINVLGYDVINQYAEIRKLVGYMPGKFSLYEDLTILENLKFYATIFNTSIEENYHLIKDIYQQIEPFKNRRAGNLSGGMKQKLALSCALIHKPEVLFLDEPTTGIDPVSRMELWDLLQNLKNEGITILASTPYMDEALRCDRIALIQKGKILKEDTPQGISQTFENNLFAIKSTQMFKLLEALKTFPKMINSYAFGEYAHAVTDAPKEDIQSYLLTTGLTDVEIKEEKVNIEDVFIAETLKNNLDKENL